MKLLLLAAMPVVLIDGNASNLERWLTIEPAVQAALECRQTLPATTLRGIPPSEPGSWTLTPARSFAVFGLPVAQVRLFIDPDGELGASYTAVIEKRSLEQVHRQLEFAGNRGRIGQLSADRPGQHVELSCTVASAG